MSHLCLDPSCGDAALSPFPDVKSSPSLHRPSDICCGDLHEEHIKFLTWQTGVITEPLPLLRLSVATAALCPSEETEDQPEHGVEAASSSPARQRCTGMEQPEVPLDCPNDTICCVDLRARGLTAPSGNAGALRIG